MEYKALKSFVGLVSMKRGEVKEISDDYIIKDLTRAGYIEPVKAKSEPEKAEPVKVESVEAEDKDEPKVEPKKSNRKAKAKEV